MNTGQDTKALNLASYAIVELSDKIAGLKKTCKSRSDTIIEYSNKIAELEHSVQLKHYKLHKALRLRDSANERVTELEKEISIAAKIMIDITNAQTVTDGGHTAGYLVTNKMMNGLDVFISKALKEQGE